MQDTTRAWRPSKTLSAPVLNAGWLAVQHVQVGLQNMGNTCYCNSVLACLAFLPPLANLLRGCLSGQALHQGACHIPPPAKCGACLFSRQLLAILSDSPRILKPIHIVTNLQTFSKTFRRGRQEDSHEFFHCLLDAVERDSKQPTTNTSKANAKGTYTLIEQLFQGRSLSQVRCMECGYESNTFELFCSLSLDIGKAATVQDSLSSFTAVEFLEGANKYKCDRCKALVRARKQVAVWDEPNVLTLHLKRFASGFSAPGSSKLGRHVRFPALLDLEPFMAHGLAALRDVGSAAHYQLSGVLVHQGGSVHSGHYYAYVADSAGAWSCVNDEHVQRVGLEDVLQQQAYMLFYVRRAVKGARQLPGPAQQQQPAGAVGPQLPVPRTPEAAGFIGPQMPSGPCSPGKRSREAYEGPESQSPRGPVRSQGPGAAGAGAKVTTLMPSGAAAARTTVLPAKLPAKLPALQPGAVAGAVGNGASVAPFKLRVIPGAGGAKAAANGHAGAGAKLHVAGLGGRPTAANDGATLALSPAEAQGRQGGAGRGAQGELGRVGSGPRVEPSGRQELTPREQVKAQLMQELRSSKFRAAVAERIEAHFMEGLSSSAPSPSSGGVGPGQLPSGDPQAALLQELLQQLVHPDAVQGKALRAQLRPQLPRLDPEFISMARASVIALHPPPRI